MLQRPCGTSRETFAFSPAAGHNRFLLIGDIRDALAVTHLCHDPNEIHESAEL